MARRKSADPAQDLVAKNLNELKPGIDAHANRVRGYNKSYDVYRASEPRNSGVAPWQSKLRVKYAMQVIDTTLVNTVTGKPRCIVRPRRPEDEESAVAMQAMLDYYVSEDHLVEKQPPFVQQGLIYGVTAAKNHWLYQESNRSIRGWAPNWDGSPMELPARRETIIDRDGPTFEPWDIYDCWWDPDARDVDAASYVVLRSWLSKDDLLRMRGSDEKTGSYHNIDELLRSGHTAERDTPAQAMHLGTTDSRRKNKFEVWEIWRDNRLTVIGNQKVVIRDEPNPYWHGKKPVVIASPRPDLFEMAGIAETELVDHLQTAMWTVQNMRMDNLHLTVQRGVTYREGGVLDPNQLVLQPRFRWPVTDHDDIDFPNIPPLPPEAYQEEANLLGRMQYVTGISPYISGADAQTVDQNTATGVSILNEVASRLLRFKAAQFFHKGYTRTYEQWGEMIKQYLDRKVAIKVQRQGSEYDWTEFGPQDVVGSYDYVLEGSEESLSKQQERAEATALLTAFAPLVQAGIVNIKPLLERVAVAYNFANPEELLTPMQPQQPASPQPANGAQPGQQQLMGGNPVQQSVDPRILQAIQGGVPAQ